MGGILLGSKDSVLEKKVIFFSFASRICMIKPALFGRQVKSCLKRGGQWLLKASTCTALAFWEEESKRNKFRKAVV